MKQQIFLISIALLLAACGGNSGKSNQDKVAKEVEDSDLNAMISPDNGEEAYPTSLPMECTYKGSKGNISAKVINGNVSLYFDYEEAAILSYIPEFEPDRKSTRLNSSH